MAVQHSIFGSAPLHSWAVLLTLFESNKSAQKSMEIYEQHAHAVQYPCTELRSVIIGNEFEFGFPFVFLVALNVGGWEARHNWMILFVDCVRLSRFGLRLTMFWLYPNWMGEWNSEKSFHALIVRTTIMAALYRFLFNLFICQSKQTSVQYTDFRTFGARTHALNSHQPTNEMPSPLPIKWTIQLRGSSVYDVYSRLIPFDYYYFDWKAIEPPLSLPCGGTSSIFARM